MNRRCDQCEALAEDFAIEGEWPGDAPGEYAEGETIAHWTIAMVARDRYEQLTGDKWTEEIVSKIRARRIAAEASRPPKPTPPDIVVIREDQIHD